MLIDPSIARKMFTPARNKESVDGAEVVSHLSKVETAVLTANKQHAVLAEHAQKLTDELAQARARIEELESVPTPTMQQIKTIELAERLHEQVVDQAKAAAKSIVDGANARVEEELAKARAEGREIIEALHDQRNTLERRIEKLSQFERDHYARITAFLQGQLDSVGTRAPEDLVVPADPDAEPAGTD